MKSVVKQIVMASLIAIVAVPAVASEINKGSKSYQTRSTKPATESVAVATDADGKVVAGSLSDIAPAAGATEPTQSSKDFMKEEIKLPRKN